MIFFHDYFNFLFSLPFHALELEGLKNALFLATTLQRSTKLAMLTLKLIKKWGSYYALNNVRNP